VSDWRRLREKEWRPLLAAYPIPAEIADRLAHFLALLGRFEGAVDLVGRVDPDSLIREHVLDSLAGAPLLPDTGTLIDVGSGNGFPAVPILLVRGALRAVLLEPRERRWAFLRAVGRELGLDADVRRERLGEHRGSGYDALTVRALGPEMWAQRAGAVIREGGLALWWTSRAAAEGVSPAGMVPVVDSPLPVPERGVIAVWRRCST
jgi:16S rRNA (guanine527-N7)-methyltransferase